MALLPFCINAHCTISMLGGANASIFSRPYKNQVSKTRKIFITFTLVLNKKVYLLLITNRNYANFFTKTEFYCQNVDEPIPTSRILNFNHCPSYREYLAVPIFLQEDIIQANDPSTKNMELVSQNH